MRGGGEGVALIYVHIICVMSTDGNIHLHSTAYYYTPHFDKHAYVRFFVHPLLGQTSATPLFSLSKV